MTAGHISPGGQGVLQGLPQDNPAHGSSSAQSQKIILHESIMFLNLKI